jgi:hypothetical protein
MSKSDLRSKEFRDIQLNRNSIGLIDILCSINPNTSIMLNPATEKRMWDDDN